MSAQFNYEKSFMGVGYEHAGGSGRTYNTDYRLQRIRSHIRPCSGAMLDLGCGGGTNTEKLAGMYKKARVYGCDISKTAIAYAKKYGGGKVTYSAMNGKKFPYKSNMFDVIVCLDVLEHVPNVQSFLKEVHRVLKKGGRLYFVVPCEGQPFTFTWWFQKIGIGSQMTRRYWGHIHPEFTHKKVISLVKRMPMRVDYVSYSEHWVYQLCNLMFYFLPKAILDVVLKKNAYKYSDQGVHVSYNAGKSARHPLAWVRDAFLYVSYVFGVLRNLDIQYGKHISFGSWKIHILAVKQ